MKKLFLLLPALLLTNYTFSQTEKGKWNLGVSSNVGNNYSVDLSNHTGFGGLNFAFGFKSDGEPVDGFSITRFSFSPGVGYFVTNGLLVRANIGFGSLKYKEDDEIYLSANSFMIGPELRYYFGDKNLRPYLGALANFGSLTQKFDSSFNEGEIKSSLTSYGGYVGVGYIIGQNASIDMSIGFTSISQKIKEEDNSTSFSNLGVNFGVNFFF